MIESTVNEEFLKCNLARNMRYLRRMRNPHLSQSMLAKKLGVTQKSISKYERACCLPPTFVLAAMAEMFGLTMDELLLGTVPIKKGREINE